MSDNEQSGNTTQNVVSMLDQYNDVDSLKMFAQAQMKTITNLSKKIKSLEDEIQRLKKSNATSAITPVQSSLQLPQSSEFNSGIVMDDEEQIVLMQIRRLRDASLERELTYEESKKLEVYYKILSSIKGKPRVVEVKAKKLTDDELLSLVGGSSDE